MIQRRQDPDFPEETRDVYGYFPSGFFVYRITADPSDGSLNVVESI